MYSWAKRRTMGRRVIAVVGLCAIAIAGAPTAAWATGPAITRTPSSISFGNVQVDTQSFDNFISVQSSGDSPVTIGAVALAGSNPGQYAITTDSCSNDTLQPFETCSVGVRFAPTSTGSKPASLQIPSSAPSSPDAVSLSGSGVNPGLTRTPSSVAFGNVQVQTTSFQNFISVQNTGTGNGPLLLGTVALSGANADQYSVTSDSCSNATLSPFASCSIGVTFAPTSTGSKTASVQIPSNAPTTPDAVALSGSGVNPGLTRTPSAIAFGNVQVQTESFENFISVQNSGTGNGPLVFGTVALAGANPSQYILTTDSCSNATLLPFGTCSIGVRFAPTSTGSKSASVQIPSNAPTNPDAVSLSGSAVNPAVTRSPSSIAFGDQQVGGSSFESFVSVQNTGTGNGPVTIGTVALAGANPGQYQIATDSCSNATLSPFTSCTVGVRFSPTSTGSKPASLHIPSNAPTSPDAVSLSGTGVIPLTASPATVAFSSQQLGQTSTPRTVTLTYSGNASATISDVAIGGANPGDYAVATDGCTDATLFTGNQCQVTVTFAPTALGSRPATLTVTSDAGTANVSLTGTGIDTIGPSNSWTTTNNSVRVSSLQSVNGTSSDPSGVQSVSVIFTDALGSQTTVAATLDCDAGNRNCDFAVTVPLMLPGPYTATIRAKDTLTNQSNGPAISLIVV